MALRKFLFQSTEGYAEQQAATDEIELGKLTLSGLAGIALDGGGQRATNFGTPTATGDLATKSYVDSVATGLDIKASVRLATAAALPAVTAAGTGVGKTLTADANGALSVDGVAAANTNRVLVKDQVAQDDNGIYVVTDAGSAGTPFVLTRATDFDQDAEVTAGAFTFVAEGTVNADTGWVLTTNDPVVVDTTNLVFSQFSSTATLTYDQGLVKSGTSIAVELDTAANAQGAGAGGGSSGLEFDVNTAAGKLRAAVHATGGLERTATGLAAKLLDGTLASAAGGLSVVKAPKTERTYTADEAIAVGDPIAWSTVTNNRVVKGRADDDAKSRIIAIARTAAAGAGNTLDATALGPVASVVSGASVGVPYYLGATGGTTATPPGVGTRTIQVGIAENATDLHVRIVDYGKKAA